MGLFGNLFLLRLRLYSWDLFWSGGRRESFLPDLPASNKQPSHNPRKVEKALFYKVEYMVLM